MTIQAISDLTMLALVKFLRFTRCFDFAGKFVHASKEIVFCRKMFCKVRNYLPNDFFYFLEIFKSKHVLTIHREKWCVNGSEQIVLIPLTRSHRKREVALTTPHSW